VRGPDPIEPTRRLVSGPDLGAGFLFQLSFDRDGSGRSFAFHAQDGGADAAGPPIGPPDFLDYRRPGSACMFGGPRCWERRFFLEESALVRARATYNRTRFCMAAMLGHQYEGTPVPFEAGLEEFLRACDAMLRATGTPYRVTGPAAAWLRGRPGTPAILRVEVGLGGAEQIGRALEPLLIEPVARRSPEEGTGGRAFLGTFKAGLRVDFGEPPPGAGTPRWLSEEIPFAGFGVPVLPKAELSVGE
jgi:hypothetical protein